MSEPTVHPRSHARFLGPAKSRRKRASFLRRSSRLVRGAWTVLQRRGPMYIVRLAGTHYWPRFAYRTFWGPQGPQPSSLLNALARLSTQPSSGTNRSATDPDAIQRAMESAHAAGVTGAVFFTNGSPAGDVAPPRQHRRTHGLVFRYFRDLDRERFNRTFGRDILTEAGARALIRKQTLALRDSTPYGGWYSSIDFGQGLSIGNFMGTDGGTGRWSYLNGRIVEPLIQGKRVLDLGSNNGVMALMMLKAGAREVVGLELSPQYVNASKLVHRIFEWRDMKSYPFTVQETSMLSLLSGDWSGFDVITAFCSLYCVEEELMQQIVARAATLAPVMILQANMPKPGGKAHSRRASAEFLQKLLIENGFPHTTLTAPRGYARPIIVGARTAADLRR